MRLYWHAEAVVAAAAIRTRLFFPYPSARHQEHRDLQAQEEWPEPVWGSVRCSLAPRWLEAARGVNSVQRNLTNSNLQWANPCGNRRCRNRKEGRRWHRFCKWRWRIVPEASLATPHRPINPRVFVNRRLSSPNSRKIEAHFSLFAPAHPRPGNSTTALSPDKSVEGTGTFQWHAGQRRLGKLQFQVPFRSHHRILHKLAKRMQQRFIEGYIDTLTVHRQKR